MENEVRTPRRTPAMVYPAAQCPEQIYPAQQALAAGTLFPELDKPMRGACMPPWETLDMQQALAFAAWELRLYLNTHPHDREALEMFRCRCREMDRPNYAGTFACPHGDRWSWLDDPWPWEVDRCDAREDGRHVCV